MMMMILLIQNIITEFIIFFNFFFYFFFFSFFLEKILMHTKDCSPCVLAHVLQNTDVLVTPHGFQSMLLLFLPRPSIIFEIFPFRYYKRGYGPFGGEYGKMKCSYFIIINFIVNISFKNRILMKFFAYCLAGKKKIIQNNCQKS